MRKFPEGEHDLVGKAIRRKASDKAFSAHDVVWWMKEMYHERSVPTRGYIVSRLRQLDDVVSIREFNRDGSVKGVRWILVRDE